MSDAPAGPDPGAPKPDLNAITEQIVTHMEGRPRFDSTVQQLINRWVLAHALRPGTPMEAKALAALAEAVDAGRPDP